MTSFTFFLFFIPILAILLLAINFIFAVYNPNAEKRTVFECGFHSFLGQNRTEFNISFYLFGLLFLIFDLEILYLFPYVLSSDWNSTFGFYVMIIFIILLTIGFVFELGKGALKIDSRQNKIVYPSKLNITSYAFIKRRILFKNNINLGNKLQIRSFSTNNIHFGPKSTDINYNLSEYQISKNKDAKDFAITRLVNISDKLNNARLIDPKSTERRTSGLQDITEEHRSIYRQQISEHITSIRNTDARSVNLNGTISLSDALVNSLYRIDNDVTQHPDYLEPNQYLVRPSHESQQSQHIHHPQHTGFPQLGGPSLFRGPLHNEGQPQYMGTQYVGPSQYLNHPQQRGPQELGPSQYLNSFQFTGSSNSSSFAGPSNFTGPSQYIGESAKNNPSLDYSQHPQSQPQQHQFSQHPQSQPQQHQFSQFSQQPISQQSFTQQPSSVNPSMANNQSSKPFSLVDASIEKQQSEMPDYGWGEED